MNLKRYTLAAISFFFVLLFSYTATSKLLDLQAFAGQLYASLLLQPVSRGLVVAIPAAELITVILLLVPAWQRRGLSMSACLMMLFTLYIAGMLIFFDQLPCSCGGVLQRMTWEEHLVFNIFCTILAMTGLILWISVHNQSTPHTFTKSPKRLIAIEQDKPKT